MCGDTSSHPRALCRTRRSRRTFENLAADLTSETAKPGDNPKSQSSLLPLAYTPLPPPKKTKSQTRICHTGSFNCYPTSTTPHQIKNKELSKLSIRLRTQTCSLCGLLLSAGRKIRHTHTLQVITPCLCVCCVSSDLASSTLFWRRSLGSLGMMCRSLARSHARRV